MVDRECHHGATMNRRETCRACKGSGVDHETDLLCESCGGAGMSSPLRDLAHGALLLLACWLGWAGLAVLA